MQTWTLIRGKFIIINFGVGHWNFWNSFKRKIVFGWWMRLNDTCLIKGGNNIMYTFTIWTTILNVYIILLPPFNTQQIWTDRQIQQKIMTNTGKMIISFKRKTWKKEMTRFWYLLAKSFTTKIIWAHFYKFQQIEKAYWKWYYHNW